MKQSDIDRVKALRSKGFSLSAIGARLGFTEWQVRTALDPTLRDRHNRQRRERYASDDEYREKVLSSRAKWLKRALDMYDNQRMTYKQIAEALGLHPRTVMDALNNKTRQQYSPERRREYQREWRKRRAGTDR